MRRTEMVQVQADAEKLAFEVARNQAGARLPIEELLDALGISEADFLALASDELFKQQVKRYKKEMEENGLSFQMKARIAAEDSIPVAYRIIHDSDTHPSTRLKALENLVEWADLKPRKQGPDPANVPTFSINFNLPSIPGVTTPGPVTIEATPSDE